MAKGITNADKYLKNGANIEELAKEIDIYIDDAQDFKYYMTNFFNAPAKHILSDDERVILRNIKNDYDIIERTIFGSLRIIKSKNGYTDFYEFNSLFKFIHNEEEYIIAELLKGE